MKKVAILISGRGSNMAALIDASKERDFPGEIVLVVSDKPDAQGLNIARARGVATLAVPRKDYPSKDAHDAAIHKALTSAGVEIVALAGYMRLLTRPFVELWQGRMINIHPSLLPLFKGLDTHQRAIDAGMRVAGCTVHFVTADMDDGPVIAQTAVPVNVDDSAEKLTARVLKAEHKLYPLALKLVCEGRAVMADGRTTYPGLADGSGEGVASAPEPLPDVMDLERLSRMTP